MSCSARNLFLLWWAPHVRHHTSRETATHASEGLAGSDELRLLTFTRPSARPVARVEAGQQPQSIIGSP
eukprot:8735580-Alexandrium_andersonii.AAC.1